MLAPRGSTGTRTDQWLTRSPSLTQVVLALWYQIPLQLELPDVGARS